MGPETPRVSKEGNEQYCDPPNEDQFRDPEPEGQCFDQDLPEGFEDGKFSPAL